MAKLDFDENKVESVIEKLADAKSTVENMEAGMSSGLGLIVGARGANYLDTSALQAGLGLSDACIDEIDNMIATIAAKADAILQYNDDVSKMGFGKRLLGTIGMGASKLVEGVFTAGEQLVDGFASIIGWVGGLFGAKKFKENVGNFVAKDHVGDAFHNFYYNTSFGRTMTQASYMKEDGKLANFTKGIGTAVGYGLAIYASGGILGKVAGFGVTNATTAAGWSAFKAGATALSSSVAVNAAAVGVGAVGGTMQAGLKIGMDYDQAFKKGVINGAVSAAFVVGMNYVMRGLSNHFKAKKAANSGNGGSGGNGGATSGGDGVIYPDEIYDPNTGEIMHFDAEGNYIGSTQGPVQNATAGGNTPSSKTGEIIDVTDYVEILEDGTMIQHTAEGTRILGQGGTTSAAGESGQLLLTEHAGSVTGESGQLLLPEHATAGAEDAVLGMTDDAVRGMTDAEIAASRAKLDAIPEFNAAGNPDSIALAHENVSFSNPRASSPLNSNNALEVASRQETTQFMENLAQSGRTLEPVSTQELSAMQNRLYELMKNPEANAEAIASLQGEMGQYITTVDGQMVRSYTTTFGSNAGTTFEGGGAFVSGLERSANSSAGAYMHSGSPQQLANMQYAGDTLTHTNVYRIVDGASVPEVTTQALVPYEGTQALVPVVETPGPITVVDEPIQLLYGPPVEPVTPVAPVVSKVIPIAPITDPGTVAPPTLAPLPTVPPTQAIIIPPTVPTTPQPVIPPTQPTTPQPVIPQTQPTTPYPVTPTTGQQPPVTIPVTVPVTVPTVPPTVPTTPTIPPTIPTVPPTVPTTPTIPPTIPPTVPYVPPTQPTTPQPRVEEYAPIPDTMVGGKSFKDYAIPAAIGAGAGVAGLAMAVNHNRRNAEYLDDDDDEGDDDYDDDFFKKRERV